MVEEQRGVLERSWEEIAVVVLDLYLDRVGAVERLVLRVVHVVHGRHVEVRVGVGDDQLGADAVRAAQRAREGQLVVRRRDCSAREQVVEVGDGEPGGLDLPRVVVELVLRVHHVVRDELGLRVVELEGLGLHGGELRRCVDVCLRRPEAVLRLGEVQLHGDGLLHEVERQLRLLEEREEVRERDLERLVVVQVERRGQLERCCCVVFAHVQLERGGGERVSGVVVVVLVGPDAPGEHRLALLARLVREEHRLVAVEVVPVVHLGDGLRAGHEHAALDDAADAVEQGQEAALAFGALEAELHLRVGVQDALVVELELHEALVGDDRVEDRCLHVDGLVGADRLDLDEVWYGACGRGGGW